MLQKQKQNVNKDHMLSSVFFFWRGRGVGFVGEGSSLELWLSLVNQQRDDGQEVNISNFRSLRTGFI